MREVAVVRADPGPDSPVYQVTVFAGVPATCDVALPNGEPATRSGGTAAGAAAPRPSAANASEFELVTVRLAPLLLRSVIAPPLIVDAAEVPVIESIFASSVWTLSVTLSWLPVAPEATKGIGVPLTLMVSPAAKLVASEFVFAAPDNVVVPVTGVGLVSLLSTTLPATCSGGSVTDGGVLKPSAVNAAEFVVVTFRLDPALLRNVIAPPLTVDGIVVPVIESIFESSVWTLSVRLSWLPVAPEATKVMGVPLTVMLSASPKLAASESVPGLPDNSVAPVIAAGGDAWLLTALPATAIGGWVAMLPKPRAANAAEFVAVKVRPVPLSLCSAITPSVTVDGVEVPVIESILVSIVWTLSVT